MYNAVTSCVLQTLSARLEAEEPQIEADLARGKQFLEDKHAPEFLRPALVALETRYTASCEQVASRREAARQALQLWEQYETARGTVMDTARIASTEVARAPIPAGQEGIQRELTSKQVGSV